MLSVLRPWLVRATVVYCADPFLLFSLLRESASSSLRGWMIRLPGVSASMSCRQVKGSASPSGSAASVATIFSRWHVDQRVELVGGYGRTTLRR